MSNLEKLIEAGAQSSAGSLILDGVEVGTYSNGEFVMNDDGAAALKALEDAPAPAPAPAPADKKPTAKKATAKKAEPKSDPEPVVEPVVEPAAPEDDTPDSLDDLLSE